MTQTATLTAQDFRNIFGGVSPLITSEWPNVPAAELEACAGDLDKVVELVAQKTEHTKTLVKKQLAELAQLYQEGQPRLEKMKEVLHQMEERSRELAKYAKSDMLPDAQDKVKENVWMSLAIALGFGVLLGFILRGSARN